MKRTFFMFALALGMLCAPLAWSQDHAEVGAFADYYHEPQSDANFGGFGGRFGVNVAKHVQAEAEMNYDFSQAFAEGFRNTGSGTVTFNESNLTVLHGLVGLKLQTRGRVRIFGTVKGGGINFRLNSQPATFAGFTSSINNLRTNNVDAVFYPGGGVEAFLGPFGFRVEAGDEIYFDRGGLHGGLRITAGPSIRF